VSTDTLNELHDVLNRPSLRKKFRTITDQVVEQIDNALSDALHATVAETPPVSRDPKDDMFLALALESGATYLVSEDKDLLVLHPYEGVSILSVLDFLHILEQLHRDA
jgi:putative PIN family toxin of toxin-antitoxin system